MIFMILNMQKLYWNTDIRLDFFVWIKLQANFIDEIYRQYKEDKHNTLIAVASIVR